MSSHPRTRLILFKNADSIYAPELLDHKNVIIAGPKIVAFPSEEQVAALIKGNVLSAVVDAAGCFLTPGLVDIHCHVTGGGGEAGPASRCNEAQLSKLLDAGITTVVGTLGTDSITRSQESLVAKCRALSCEGISAYHWAGGYRLPVATLTGSVQRELVLLEGCMGAGEVAVSDHRSSVPTSHELACLASECRVGGLLSGKAGLLYCHMGSGASRLRPLREAVAASDVPISQFLPTHMERSPELAEEGLAWLREGGSLDFTAGAKAREALRAYRDQGAFALDRCSVSSDSFGSYPVFDAAGKLVSYEVNDPAAMLAMLRDMHLKDGWPLEDALTTMTSTPAETLKLHQKGKVELGRDADLLLLDAKTLELQNVIAKGKLVRSPAAVRGGAYERGPRVQAHKLELS